MRTAAGDEFVIPVSCRLAPLSGPARHTSEPVGGPSTLKEMVSENHDYRGDW